MRKNKDPSSFRDPSGYIYYENDEIFRAIDKSYAEHYEFLQSSGLYKKLESEKMIIPHQECIPSQNTYKVIQPELVKIISYPYEWSFTQLKDVALQLLKIQKISLDFDMTLKDATPFNFQFVSNNPILIDTLSFEKYNEGELWRPYQQFCEFFLSPLLLARYVDPRILKITQTFMNGIPLDLTSKLLPFKTKFMLSTILNIHLHAKSQKKYSKQGKNHTKRKLSKRSLLGIINNLE